MWGESETVGQLHVLQIKPRRKWKATCCKCLSINKNHCLLFCARPRPKGNAALSLSLPACMRVCVRMCVRVCWPICLCAEVLFIACVSLYPHHLYQFEANSCHMRAAGGRGQLVYVRAGIEADRGS